MLPQSQPRKRRNSSRVNLLISVGFHGVVLIALFYFAAHQGLLGTQLRKIAVEMVKATEPEPEPEEVQPEPELATEPDPQPEPEPSQPIADVVPPPLETASTPPPPQPSLIAPPTIAPPAAQLPSFAFEGGRAVQTASDPNQLYKGLIEYSLRANWNRPVDLDDSRFVAEVEVAVDTGGRLSDPAWKKSSGNDRWDASVRQALAATPIISRSPPGGFPTRVLIRFDVMEVPDLANSRGLP